MIFRNDKTRRPWKPAQFDTISLPERLVLSTSTREGFTQSSVIDANKAEWSKRSINTEAGVYPNPVRQTDRRPPD